ncbi:lipid II flippase family protein [Caulobacter segnis]
MRIAGVRTRRIAMSFALFNVLVLLSRALERLPGPVPVQADRDQPAGRYGRPPAGGLPVADGQRQPGGPGRRTLAIPTAQRLFTRAVAHFQVHRSIPKLLLRLRQGRACPMSATRSPCPRPAT